MGRFLPKARAGSGCVRAVGARPRGVVRLRREGETIFEGRNLVVNAGLPAFAKLTAGASAGQSVSVVGYGSGNMAPTVSDTDLAVPPKYYNAVGTATFPSPGTVVFNFALQASDYAAYGMTIQEIGLFANASGAPIPSVAGFSYPAWVGASAQPFGNLVQAAGGYPFRSTSPPAWTAGALAVAGQLVTDPKGNLQECTTGGTTGAIDPAWSVTVGDTTSDGSAVWTCKELGGYTPATGAAQPVWNAAAVGAYTFDNTVAWQLVAALATPQPMIAHAIVPAFTFGGTANYSGTWSLTF
jgi:hypothetical protein